MNLPVYIVSCVIFFALSIPIHELGHLIFGIITGYHFSSFKLFNLTWVKENGKLILKKSKNNYLAGQCLMTPPKDEEKFKFVLYNLGGGLLNLIMAIILFVCAVIFIENDYLAAFFVAGTVTNILMAIMNLLPMNSAIPNDGMNVFAALQSKQAKHGLYIMLYVNHETTEGKRYKDFDDNLFVIEESADYNNYFVAYTVMCEATRLYDMGKYDDCIQTYSVLNLNKLQTYYSNSVKLDYMYYYIIHNPDFDKAKEIYTDPKMKKYLKMTIPTITRVLSAYEFFVNNDREKGKELLNKAKKEIKHFPNKGVVFMEDEYLKELEKIMINSII